jgi:hypothetical protein
MSFIGNAKGATGHAFTNSADDGAQPEDYRVPDLPKTQPEDQDPQRSQRTTRWLFADARDGQ